MLFCKSYVMNQWKLIFQRGQKNRLKFLFSQKSITEYFWMMKFLKDDAYKEEGK